MKKCIKCKDKKHPDLFSTNNRYKDGKDSVCRECRKQQRIIRKANYIRPSEGDVKILEIRKQIDKVSKLPKSERWLSYNNILDAVACLNDRYTVEQKDSLKIKLHNLIETVLPERI